MLQSAANASIMLHHAKAVIKDAGHKTAPWISRYKCSFVCLFFVSKSSSSSCKVHSTNVSWLAAVTSKKEVILHIHSLGSCRGQTCHILFTVVPHAALAAATAATSDTQQEKYASHVVTPPPGYCCYGGAMEDIFMTCNHGSTSLVLITIQAAVECTIKIKIK